jgi:hypothetical protein
MLAPAGRLPKPVELGMEALLDDSSKLHAAF